MWQALGSFSSPKEKLWRKAHTQRRKIPCEVSEALFKVTIKNIMTLNRILRRVQVNKCVRCWSGVLANQN